MKPFVYLAGPYTKGDPCINTYSQQQAYLKALDDGIVLPFAPLLSHHVHTAAPRHYTVWLNYDLELLEHVDALLRLDATCPELNYHESQSSGADKEEAYMRKLGKPVFYTWDALYDWVKNEYRP